jgi:hypothetical protein
MEHRARAYGRMPLSFSVLVFLLIALLGPDTVSCAAVERRMELQDVSEKGSPITVSGYVTSRYDDSKKLPFSYQENILARNVSNKSLLLVVMHLRVSGTPGRDETFLQEYFFGNALEPGAVDVNDEPGASFGRTVNGVPLVASEHELDAVARVRVEFVQFGDGSSWGDAKFAENVLKMRSDALAELYTLEHIYEQAGEEALLEELARADDYLPVINQLKWACRDKAKKSDCAHDAVQRKKAALDTGLADEVSPPR